MSATIIIQVILIVVVIMTAARLFRSRGARAQAIRRIGVLLFAGLAVLSILLPDTWTKAANLVGVGRGTDLVLYSLVIAFLSATVTNYLRFRELELRYTRLARHIALDTARRPGEDA